MWYERPLTYGIGGRDLIDMACEDHRILSATSSLMSLHRKA